MNKHRLHSYICCTIDVTYATRLIAFFGIAISALLLTVLLKDRAKDDFHISRNIALALGLDWRHLHPNGSVAKHADPEGNTVTTILIFYSIVYFFTNTLLFYATIFRKCHFTYPWLLFESLSCISKVGALVFHIATEFEDLSKIFINGSFIYIGFMVWWFFVVYSAQSKWCEREEETITLSLAPQPYVPNVYYATI